MKKKLFRIMNAEQIVEFAKDKTIYSHGVGWLEKWNGTPLPNYFPLGGFMLGNEFISQPFGRSGYGPRCLSLEFIKPDETKAYYYELPRWTVSVSKKAFKPRYYVYQVTP